MNAKFYLNPCILQNKYLFLFQPKFFIKNKFCLSASDVITITASNSVCKGTTGIQYWILSDGTGGTNNNNASNDDFCYGDGWVAGGSSYEFMMLDCSSPGTTQDASLTVSLGTGCHYILVDGFQGDYCDFDMSISGITSILTPNAGREQMKIKIHPNPFSTSATLTVENSEFSVKNLEFRIYDLLGREVKQFTMHDAQLGEIIYPRECIFIKWKTKIQKE